MELWGGVECTVNRVGSRYFDQLELSSHGTRASDIERIASLGIRTVRYPVLWERTAPSNPAEASWRWADERLESLAAQKIDPIIGLVHHGSGPRHTSLIDDRFPAKLTDYADAVAERYAHIRAVTPINEPLTTARFATLYGHWYPHKKTWGDFAAAILNQCIATRDAMKAMRARIPELQLVQTEDLGHIYSTPRLAYQARFENERRWLTFDLLCGRVDEQHPMWRHLAITEGLRQQLTSLLEQPCPPDIIGINYYVTSDRFLDDRDYLYSTDALGGNGRHRYADVEAVRSVEEGITGHKSILSEAWDRYRIPLAVTEVHLGCTREHQLRWLAEAWQGACDARVSGCDVRAVTAWALFGSFGWDTLVTREPFGYEPGAFDVRSSEPRETALATMIRNITSRADCSHPAIESTGWWRKDDRLSVPAFSIADRSASRIRCANEMTHPILITGASGTLGSALVRVARARGLAVQPMTREQLDIGDQHSVRRAISVFKPWAIINAAGYVRVDDAEREKSQCYRANAFGVSVLARECASAGIQFVTYSSDLVFDGLKRTPYVESDRTAPLNTYGAAKIEGEISALRLNSQALVIRTAAFFGPWDDWNFPIAAIRSLANGIPFPAADDAVVSPTYVPDLADASLDLLIDGEKGIWHLANAGALTWADFARDIALRAGISLDLVRPVPSDELGFAAQRPAYSALSSERASLLPSLENALDRWTEVIRANELTSSPALQP